MPLNRHTILALIALVVVGLGLEALGNYAASAAIAWSVAGFLTAHLTTVIAAAHMLNPWRARG
jgi:hypothetical protein